MKGQDAQALYGCRLGTDSIKVLTAVWILTLSLRSLSLEAFLLFSHQKGKEKKNCQDLQRAVRMSCLHMQKWI